MSACVLLLLCISCAARQAGSGPAEPMTQADPPAFSPASGDFSETLPMDALQPWERSASAISAESEFVAGRDLFSSSLTGAGENGEATRLESTAAAAWASYRIPTGGQAPGVLSLDVNLLAAQDGGRSGYYVAVANYGTGRWDWRGPFTDSHVRLALPESGMLSPVNSFFATVLCHGGSSVDIVGLGLGMRNPADSTPPPAPIALTATAVAGGAELQWFPVLSGDLAGYEIFRSGQSFSNPLSVGVTGLGYIEGSTHAVLSGLSTTSFVRIRAVDLNGNASELSDEVMFSPLAGAGPELLISSDAVSAAIGEPVSISVSGGDSYDYDLDGNGVFEITGDTSGSFSVDTTQAGIIRPRVRASGSGGEAVALGSVSLIVTGNSRPVASASADPQSGLAPLDVTFSGEAEDGEDGASALSFAWDFDGDGIYEPGTDTLSPPLQTYTAAGSYNVKLRVTDSEGAWDVDTLSVLATEGGIHAELSMARSQIAKGEFAVFSAQSSTSSSTITKYEWDLDGDLTFELDMGTDPLFKRSFDTVGFQQVALRVTDDLGRTDIDIDTLVVEGWSEPADIAPGGFSISAEISGTPALAHTNFSEQVSLQYVRANDWLGLDWNAPIPIGYEDYSVIRSRLLVVDGNPAVFFTGSIDNELNFVRANDPQGSSWPAPALVTTDVDGIEIFGALVVDGNPAAACSRFSDDALMFVRAVNAQGSAWSAPVVANDLESFGSCDLIIANGRPAIAARINGLNNLVWLRADNVQGTAWGAIVTVDNGGNVGLFPRALVTNGIPGIFHVENGITKPLKYSRAMDADGTAWDIPVVLDDSSNSNATLGVAVVDGKPAAAYKNPNFGTMFLQALDANGKEWEAPLLVIPAEDAFADMSMIAGRPFISISGNGNMLRFVNYRP
ncbi:PKD domain-containing protein [bacterium]|nr:PKD domain-containing protein [bacterium]